MSLSFLVVPFFTGFAAFVLAVFHNVSAVNIESISVPTIVSAKTGYTADVVVKRLADRMQDIEQQALSRADAKEVLAQDEGGAAGVLGEFFELTPLLRVVQTSFGMIPYTFSGEIVVNGPRLEMVLRGTDANHHETLIREDVFGDAVPDLVDKVAYEAVRMIDPALLASYQFRRDYLTRDFTPTVDVIRKALANRDVARSHKWLNNLWGIVLYQQSDNEGAVAKFRDALEVDPAFGSPMLNWGVVLARHGQQQEAIDKFRQVVSGWKPGDPADTLAAAYSEWGFSLALLGNTEDAFTKFRQAVVADPTFSDVYSAWAEVLSASGHGDEAQKMTAKALALTSKEVVNTDNLVGRIQHLPAVASNR